MTCDPAKEVERLTNIIRQAKVALEDGRRGDCLKMLKGALPTPPPPPGYSAGGHVA